MTEVRRILLTLVLLGAVPAASLAQTACTSGMADGYPCNDVDLAAHMSPVELGGALGISVNDIWGWTDNTTGREYALVGREDGTAFVDVTDPVAPIYLGNLPTNTVAAIWRDIKVYDDHAYIVADGAGNHGMQVFDLTTLRGMTVPQTFSAVAVYDSIGSAHNIVINESSGFGYAVGVNSAGQSCGGGLHMIDLTTPDAPAFVGCFSHVGTGRRGTGYTHDAQCVNYAGPDADYTGREICVGSNETDISLADVSDKGNPQIIAKASYPTAQYVHQGWFTDDHRYFYQDDELDERRGAVSTTRTVIWDLTDLDDPQMVSQFDHGSTNIDHNMYVVGDRLFQAHYLNGLRITDVSNPENLVEVGYFDTMPNASGQGGGGVSPFDGAWSVYPFFASGNVLVSSSNGLFIVQPRGGAAVSVDEPSDIPLAEDVLSIAPNPLSSDGVVTLKVTRSANVSVGVYDVLGREVVRLANAQVTPGSTFEYPVNAEDLPSGTYFVVVRGGEVEISEKLVVVK